MHEVMFVKIRARCEHGAYLPRMQALLRGSLYPKYTMSSMDVRLPVHVLPLLAPENVGCCSSHMVVAKLLHSSAISGVNDPGQMTAMTVGIAAVLLDAAMTIPFPRCCGASAMVCSHWTDLSISVTITVQLFKSPRPACMRMAVLSSLLAMCRCGAVMRSCFNVEVGCGGGRVSCAPNSV